MQKFAIRLILFLSILFFATQKSIADTYPKREFRGVWFTTVWGNDWPSNPGTSNQSTQKAELLKYIDALEDLNISTICFQVRGMSDAMYQSSTLPDGLQIPWSQYLSGTNNRGVSPGWDPLAYVVQECHNRGIEVYAWINPFRWANGSTEWTTTYDKTIKNKGWLMSNGTTTVLNPGIPEVRQHITYICKDIISRYGIEGIIFDDYFYPNGGTPETSEAPDYTHWINSGTSLSFGDWRRQNVDLTIESIYNMIQETRPEVRLVAGPSPLAGASASKYGLTLWPNGYDNQYSTLYSDPLSWMDKRIVDMMATQIYWHRDHKLAPYNTITDWWYSLAKHFDLHNCVSMNVYDFETVMNNQTDLGKTTAHYDEHVANILASREYAAKYGVKSTGVNFYDTRHLVSVKSGYDYQEHGQYLRDNCFQLKSITPEIHWKNTPIYNAVTNLAYSSGTLSWTAAPIPTGAHSLTTIRYTVYAIPNSVSYEAASTDDGFSVEYLQGITYSPNYTLSSDKRSGYWYAVCVFDGFGNEHAPAIYNYTGGTSAKTTLTSPSNSSSANWDQTFSWNVIPGATYHLQISTFENFSNILIDQPNLSTNSVTINLENLVEGETYYWKVTTQESGKTATDSEIFSFSVTTLTNSPLAQLESPQNNATLSSSTTFSWSNDDEHVTSFTFQIASDASFSNIINSQDIDKASDEPTSTTIDIKGMDAGTYYWRVISKGRIYIDTPSEYRTFIVASLPSIEFSLISPDNNAQIENTQTFEWDAIDGASYLFEIATTEDFRNVIKSENLSSNNYELTVDELIFSPTYFWRVTTFKDGYKNTTSAIRTFAKSLDYNPAGNLSITPIWNHSINSEGLPEDLSGDNMRSMTAHNGKIYVAKRTSTNALQLLEFSANTGVLVNTITLTGDCTSHSSYGANGIFVDDANNLCITSIGMSAGTPLTVCTIDPDTYETTNIFSYGEASLRIDYANALGDVTKTGGQIWAAVSSSGSAKNNYVYRWTRQSDGTWKTEYTIINTFNPTSATDVGSAPWVMPLPNDKFIVDGSSNFPTLYTFKANDNATYESGFADDSECAPINFEGAGMAQITIGQTPLFIYSNETSAANGYSFNIVHNPSSFDFSKMEKYWTIPKVKLGDENHPYVLNSIATIDNNDGSVTIFVYAPKNGLAAYRISLPEIEISLNSPANNVTFEEDFDFSWSGVEGASYTLEISKTATFEDIVFNATTTSTSYNSSNFNLASETKYYWRVKASCENYISTTSEVRTFTSPYKESTTGNLSIEKLWDYNISNLPTKLTGDNKRSMTAYNGNIYFTYRASKSELYLLEFNGKTGDFIRQITLTGACVTGEYGANGIFVDGGNNLCVVSMGTSSTIPATVCTVDISTGKTTQIFSYGAEYLRFDYINARGDITKTGGEIWAASSKNSSITTNNNRIYRWTRKSDGTWTTASTVANSFYPTTGETGITPWVLPISSSQFIVDGGSNYPSLYTFNAGGYATLVDGFNSSSELKPAAIGGVGMHQLEIGDYPLFVYNNETHEGAGFNFNIAYNSSSYNFANLELFWTIPEVNMGKTNHQYGLNSIASIKNDDNSATVYVYAPKNGFAAYRIYLPDMPITLNSPINNVQTLDGFDFTWSGVEGAKYTIELSTSESFDNIAFSATTEDLMYSSYNFNLAGSTKYYWRIKASHDNYTTTTSAVAQFISPEKPTMTPPQLFVPYNGTTHASDISFVAKKSYLLNGEEKIYASKYILEISTSDDFSDIFYCGDSKWKEKSSETSNYEIWLQYTLPISQFHNGTYYWRVIAQSNNSDYGDGISEVRSFIVVDQYDESATYKMVRETSSYPEIGFGGNNYISLYNNWIRSATYNNGISQANGGSYARGFCVRPDKNGEQNGMDIIYIPNDDKTTANLDYYNAATGEFLGTLQMIANNGTTIATSTYPCHGLFVDNEGNLCFYNLAGAGGILQLCTVDVDLTKKTAVATERFSYTVANRVDHCRAYGDVANKDFTLFGAASGSNTIYRWSVDGSDVGFNNKSISTNTTNFGSNIMAFPVSEDLVYIDGNYSNLALYNFERGIYINQFTQSNKALCGGGFFIHNNANHFMVYPNIGGSTSQHQYKILSIEDITTGNSGATTRWNIPTDENALPAHSNTTYGTMLVDYLPKLGSTTKSANRNPNTTLVYLYVPGSGLASYSITSHIVTGAESIKSNSIKIATTQDEIKFGSEVNNAQIYTLSGMLINSTNSSSSIEKPLNKGVYILQLTINGVVSTHKIVI